MTYPPVYTYGAYSRNFIQIKSTQVHMILHNPTWWYICLVFLFFLKVLMTHMLSLSERDSSVWEVYVYSNPCYLHLHREPWSDKYSCRSSDSQILSKGQTRVTESNMAPPVLRTFASALLLTSLAYAVSYYDNGISHCLCGLSWPELWI